MKSLLSCFLLAGVLGSSIPTSAEENRSVGAPQLLEIPAQPDAEPDQTGPRALSPSQDEQAIGRDSEIGQQPAGSIDETELDLAPVPSPLPYLGVLFATAEVGTEGVRVLRVIEGSPAARAGFEGADAPLRSEDSLTDDLLKGALMLLAVTPANPLVFPILIARKEYRKRNPPGDIIVAVANEAVRNAQDFNTVLRRFQPGQTIQVSVLRQGEPLQLPVQLEAEPLTESAS